MSDAWPVNGSLWLAHRGNGASQLQGHSETQFMSLRLIPENIALSQMSHPPSQKDRDSRSHIHLSTSDVLSTIAISVGGDKEINSCNHDRQLRQTCSIRKSKMDALLLNSLENEIDLGKAEKKVNRRLRL